MERPPPHTHYRATVTQQRHHAPQPVACTHSPQFVVPHDTGHTSGPNSHVPITLVHVPESLENDVPCSHTLSVTHQPAGGACDARARRRGLRMGRGDTCQWKSPDTGATHTHRSRTRATLTRACDASRTTLGRGRARVACCQVCARVGAAASRAQLLATGHTLCPRARLDSAAPVH